MTKQRVVYVQRAANDGSIIFVPVTRPNRRRNYHPAPGAQPTIMERLREARRRVHIQHYLTRRFIPLFEHGLRRLVLRIIEDAAAAVPPAPIPQSPIPNPH